MRSRRDCFARQSFIPVVAASALTAPHAACSWCGQPPAPRRPLYAISLEPDGGRTDVLKGQFDSWDCAEAYHNTTFPR